LELAVRLVDWRKKMDWTQERLAEALHVRQPYVSTMERSREPAIPGRKLMLKIYLLTGGDVQPNDFYELPALAELQLDVAA
jgi:transcriptional regulator with XRE-family HTH domain